MTPQALFDYNSLMQDMLNTNAAYLAISVGIIIFIGGFIFLFNIKPFQEKLAKTELDLEEMKKENNKLLEETDNLREKIEIYQVESVKKIGKVVKDMETQFTVLKNTQKSELSNLRVEFQKEQEKIDHSVKYADLANEFREYWIWSAHDIPINSLRALSSSLQKACELNQTSTAELCLKNIERILTDEKDRLLEDAELEKVLTSITTNIKFVNSKKYAENIERIKELVSSYSK